MPPEELRLLVVASTYPAGATDGTPGFVRDLAAGEARHLTTLVLVPRVPGAPLAEQDGSLEVHRFRYFPSRWEDLAHGAILENLRERPSRWLQVVPFLICEAIAVRRIIRRFKPHVLHVHWLLPQGLVTRLVARGTPRLLTVHGGDLYALCGRLPRMLKRWALRDASAITVMNADMRRRIGELGVAPPAHVLPMGAAVEELRAAMAGVERIGGRVLFVGRLVEKKGVAVLLRALTGLDPEAPWSLEVVGDGPLRCALEAASATLPGDRVRFRGTLDRKRVAEAMAASQIVVLPSVPAASGDQDGRPVVLVEAMAAGCAIVASRLPGLDEVIVDGVNGLLVPPGDADALAGAISRVLTDPALRQRLASAASAAADDFSSTAMAARYVELLRQSVGRGGDT